MNKDKHLRLFVLICGLLAPVACAQTAFPNDVHPPTAQFLQPVCSDQTDPGGQLACTCPAGSLLDVDGYGWKLTGVTVGHFLSPTSDDAVVAMQGCETHADNYGGTVLLTRQPGGWVKDWYKAGVVTSQCHKVTTKDNREILACIGASGVQGASSTELYVEDMLRPGTTLMGEDEAPFFRVNDDLRACGTDGVITHSVIEKVEFSDATPAAISVTASLGKRPAAGCVAPALTRYRFEFAFDKGDYQLLSTRSVE